MVLVTHHLLPFSDLSFPKAECGVCCRSGIKNFGVSQASRQHQRGHEERGHEAGLLVLAVANQLQYLLSFRNIRPVLAAFLRVSTEDRTGIFF